MKLKKPVIIVGIVAILVLVIGGYFLFKKPAEAAMVTATVKRGTLTQTVDATGVLESLDKVDLAFGTSGTIGLVLVEVGDEVKAGDLLVSLDVAGLQAERAAAAQAVEIARANLEQKEAGSTDEVVKVAEAQVASAQASLDAASASLVSVTATSETSVAEAQTNLDNSKEDLENVEIDNEENLSEAYEDLVQVLKNNTIVVRSALSDADEVLGIDNTMANDDFENILAANDSQPLTSAQNSYRQAKIYRNSAEDLVFALTLDSEVSAIETATEAVRSALSETADTLLYTRRALDGTNIDTADFSSDDLSVLKTSIDAARNSVQTDEEALNTQLQTVSQLKISNTSSLDSAENLVTKYEKILASAEAGAASSISSAETTVLIRQATLSEADANLAQVKATPRAIDLAAFEATVAQAQAKFAQVEVAVSDAEIYSPIDGKVTAVEVKQGEQASALAAVVTVQTTTNRFQIVSDVSEADISKISLNDSVDITFDAFGDDKKFVGQVIKIDPAEKNIDDVIYYKVTVYLDSEIMTQDVTSELKPGMTTDLTILTAKIDNTLMIPQRAILEHTDGTKYVRLPSGDSYKEQTVTIGTRGDEGMMEILSGLSENETIIVSIRS
ncbi:MAG: biotin/lipoyl-binding protein [Candidatus Uhrbacteria bacterium]